MINQSWNITREDTTFRFCLSKLLFWRSFQTRSGQVRSDHEKVSQGRTFRNCWKSLSTF